MPPEWADDFDPLMEGWHPHTGPVRDMFPGVVEKGWREGMTQRDFYVHVTPARVETLVIEWRRPWSEVIAIVRDGVEYTEQPSDRATFDRLWKRP